MVGIVLQPAVLHLQLLFRGLQIVGQRFHTNMGATQIIILSEHQRTGEVIHMAISRMEITEVDIIEMLDFIMGDINDIDILRQGWRRPLRSADHPARLTPAGSV